MTAWRLASWSVVTAIAVVAAGCAAPLPQYAWQDGRAALRTMAQRDGSIETFSASCRMLLESDAGHVELTGALVGKPPGRLRLRAWKFSQAVFDVTLNDDGLFILDKNRSTQSRHRLEKVDHRRFVDAIALLPGFRRGVSWQVDGDGDGRTFTIRSRADDLGAGMACTVDKNTLVRTQCEYRDASGRVRQRLSFDEYTTVGGVVWPRRVEGSGESGSFTLLFDRIDVNVELAARAFVPPRRAVKQP